MLDFIFVIAYTSHMRISENLGSVLRELRSKLKLSQEELAARLNVSFATVNRWENDKATPQGAGAAMPSINW